VASKEEKAKQIEKAKKDNKNIFGRIADSIRQYFDETIGELRKVTWPTRKEAINLTIVVLIVMVSMSVALGFLDFLYSQFFRLLFA